MAQLDVRYQLAPLKPLANVVYPSGTPIHQLIRDLAIPKEYHDFLMVFRNGAIIKDYDLVMEENEKLTIAIVPKGGGGGGKGGGILGTVASIAISYAAPYAAPYVAGATGLSIPISTALISLAGSLLVSALIPPPAPSNLNSSQAFEESLSYNLTGQSNQANVYGGVPAIYGKIKFYPYIGAQAKVMQLGKRAIINALFDFGLGHLDLSDIRIGAQPAENLGAQFITHTNTRSPDLKYVTSTSGYDQLGFNLSANSVTLETKPNADAVAVTMVFTRGLAKFNDQGNPSSYTVPIKVEIRKRGDTEWELQLKEKFRVEAITIANDVRSSGTVKEIIYTTHGVKFTGATAQPNSVRFEAIFNDPGTYDVRVTREDKESTNTRVLDTLQITSIETLQNQKPVQLDHPHTMLEMQVQSSERLTGNVDNLSAMVSKRIRDIDANGFIEDLIETSNPALIALDILTNDANREPLRNDQIDFPSFVKLKDFCDEDVTFDQGGVSHTRKRYEFNGLVVGNSVQEAVNNVLGNGRAQLLMLQNGKFGVLIDHIKTVPRQLITPANSWNFRGTRTYPHYPDALRVSYVEPELNWATSEITVYANGFDQTNAKRFEEIKTTGVTNYHQADRYARYMIAQGIFRSEIFTVNMDVENLAVVRGDLVLVQHDVPKLGAPALRVVEVNGTTIKISQDIEIPVDASYTVRTLDGDVKTGKVTAQVDSNILEIEVEDTDITEDALMAIGETNLVTSPYLVLSVSPMPDLTATLELTPYNEEVYAEVPLPEWNPGFSGDLIATSSLKVINLNAQQALTYVNREPQVDIGLTWDIDGQFVMLERVDVYYTVPGQEPIFCGSSSGKTLIWKVWPNRQKELINRADGYFTATPYSKLAIEGESDTLIYAILGDTTPPNTVDGFAVNILNNAMVDIFWHRSVEPDIMRYELRFTPELTAPLWNAASHLASVPWTTNRVSAGARTGSYGLMAIDSSDNRSVPQWLRTSVETLPQLNYVIDLNDAPTWPGNKINCNTDNGALMLNGDFGSVTDQIGYYEFLDIYDANQIQELRCISYLEGFGVSADDFMVNWIPLAPIKPLAAATERDFDYWLEVSSTNTQTFMKDWIPLSGEAADPIAGQGVGWQPWRRIESADITGQLFKFRIAMASYNPKVNVKMMSGKTQIDVLDRFESYPNMAVPSSGVRIDFDPPFRAAPSVAISIDGNTENVRYEVRSKTANSVEIVLISGSNTQVAGQIDVNVQGYGKVRSTSL